MDVIWTISELLMSVFPPLPFPPKICIIFLSGDPAPFPIGVQ